ncbi:hypothetical protein AWB68_06068 [Caballeronia choica]|jgi:uncharacterized protein (DUF4415 family)|uniref:BrnA antitoxin of type II toxin-antitoxin system n=1 Tax=Caballeronia choica TaxID=326476 RepID=A0A158KKY8_9BURK|nr:hypothetical protein AWB68_06068 [Caballeronia choica]
MNKKLKLTRHSPEEEAQIQRGIDSDPETFIPSDEQFAKMKPLGRPRLESPKVQLTVRYDADIVEAFKATGEGWQTRMNNALREWLQTHRAA